MLTTHQWTMCFLQQFSRSLHLIFRSVPVTWMNEFYITQHNRYFRLIIWMRKMFRHILWLLHPLFNLVIIPCTFNKSINKSYYGLLYINSINFKKFWIIFWRKLLLRDVKNKYASSFVLRILQFALLELLRDVFGALQNLDKTCFSL